MRRKVWVVGVSLSIVLSLVGRTWADSSVPEQRGPLIGAIAIEGNDRVEENAIRTRLSLRPGDSLDKEAVDRDVRSIYEMGFFQTVDAVVEQENSHTLLIYRVKERPLIREVRIEGNESISSDDIEVALKIHPRTIFNPMKMRRGIEDVKKAYEEKGYLDAEISYRAEMAGAGETIVTFTIQENDTTGIKEVVFEGNTAFPSSQLQAIMATRKKNFLSRFMNVGTLNREALKTDTERLTAFYYDHGYINVRIDEPKVVRKEDGLYVVIRIDEGNQFTVGEVGVTGKYPGTEEQAMRTVGLKPGETFKASLLRDDVFRLTGYFSNQGYAFVNVEPDTQVSPDKDVVKVTYRVDTGPEVYIDRIEIAGNQKTRDKVIRRQLRIYEQGKFNASGLQASRARVQRLGFFEDVNLATKRGARRDLLNVLVDVKEAQTGAFSIGAGFNSSTSIVGTGRLQENNLFGYGQQLTISGSIGTKYRNTSASWTDPYFLDTPVTLGVDVFDWRFAFDDFDRAGTGGGFRLLYPLADLGLRSIWGFSLEDIRSGFSYQWERSRISNFEPITPGAIRAEGGTTTTSRISPMIRRNTLDNPFDATAGSLQQLSFTYAGLGGEADYTKAELEARFYIPIYRSRKWGEFTWMTNTFIGYGVGDIDYSSFSPISGAGEDILKDDIPLFDRYFPGGINSVRGFDDRELGPREAVTVLVSDDNTPQGVKAKTYYRPIGGSQQAIFNNELIFPLLKQMKLNGVVFNDIGNAFTNEQGLDFGDLRYSVGAGIRWRSPFGPIRVELAKALNPQPDEKTSNIHFSFGGFGGGGGGGSPF